MRLSPLLATAVLAVPALLMPATALVLPLPPLPLNAVQDGDFEDGLSSWTLRGAECDASLVSPGADGTAHALLIRETPRSHCYADQAMPIGLQDVLIVGFWADVAQGQGVDHFQGFGIYAGSAATSTLLLVLSPGNLRFHAYAGPPTTMSVNTTGWHHYNLVLDRALGTAVLLQDGVQLGWAMGNAGAIPPATEVWVGDGVGNFLPGSVGPDVVWDEIYVTPGV